MFPFPIVSLQFIVLLYVAGIVIALLAVFGGNRLARYMRKPWQIRGIAVALCVLWPYSLIGTLVSVYQARQAEKEWAKLFDSLSEALGDCGCDEQDFGGMVDLPDDDLPKHPDLLQ